MLRALAKVMLVIGILLLLPLIGWVCAVIGLATPIIAAILILCLPLIIVGIIIGRRSRN